MAERILLGSPGPVQQTVQLCCLDGIDQSEAARTLGVSTRTVAARLARFRRQLRHALGEKGQNAGSRDSSR